ncbi:hypothetical protein EV360DRAFT_76883 [Lentinula raphanica]|nr:hypothetical protein EV360DRAFT_76883 [Lentinula raphanica]
MDNVHSKKSSVETSWWRFLDDYPDKARDLLNTLMKECSQSRHTLGFSTFLAGTCLFEDKVSCTVAKTVLTEQDEIRVHRSQMLQLKTWDAVFIPIHEGSSHWYSARIGFKLKRIDVFDSLQETCIINCRKPVSLRKNTNLMLVLMWLTEILSSMREEPVCLTNNPRSEWVCDPHKLSFIIIRSLSSPTPSTAAYIPYGI